MAGMKTVTLKLNRADHDLLIPNIDTAIKLLKLIPTKEEREKGQKEGAKDQEERKKEQEKRKAEQTKEALESLTEKEREWLRKCNKDAYEFKHFKDRLFSLRKDLERSLSLSQATKHLLDEWLEWENDIPEPVKPLIDELVNRIDSRRDEWNEFIELEWGNNDEPGKKENDS